MIIGKREARGEFYIVRYTDDSVLGFQYRSYGYLMPALDEMFEDYMAAMRCCRYDNSQGEVLLLENL